MVGKTGEVARVAAVEWVPTDSNGPSGRSMVAAVIVVTRHYF
jgi:hypothetical protein